MAPVSKDITRVEHKVGTAERAARLKHRGAVVWLTGLSASGKSTLSMELERSLLNGVSYPAQIVSPTLRPSTARSVVKAIRCNLALR